MLTPSTSSYRDDTLYIQVNSVGWAIGVSQNIVNSVLPLCAWFNPSAVEMRLDDVIKVGYIIKFLGHAEGFRESALRSHWLNGEDAWTRGKGVYLVELTSGLFTAIYSETNLAQSEVAIDIESIVGFRNAKGDMGVNLARDVGIYNYLSDLLNSVDERLKYLTARAAFREVAVQAAIRGHMQSMARENAAKEETTPEPVDEPANPLRDENDDISARLDRLEASLHSLLSKLDARR